jgi:hypothetical protein
MASNVPAALILPVIHNYLKEYESNLDGAQEWGTALVGLMNRAGVHPDNYSKWSKRADRSWMKFDTADKLMSAMHANHLWHVPPLSDIYWTLKLPSEKDIARSKRNHAIRMALKRGEMGVCVQCGERFVKKPKGQHRKFCKQACASRYHRQKVRV